MVFKGHPLGIVAAGFTTPAKPPWPEGYLSPPFGRHCRFFARARRTALTRSHTSAGKMTTNIVTITRSSHGVPVGRRRRDVVRCLTERRGRIEPRLRLTPEAPPSRSGAAPACWRHRVRFGTRGPASRRARDPPFAYSRPPRQLARVNAQEPHHRSHQRHSAWALTFADTTKRTMTQWRNIIGSLHNECETEPNGQIVKPPSGHRTR